MQQLHENYDLTQHNTFGIKAKARYFFEFDNADELCNLLKQNDILNSEYMTIGGGSNLLFTDDYNGLIIHPTMQGIEVVSEDNETILVRVGANHNWDDFVAWSVANNYGGVENLSLIPGVVGAAPVQNIGAYGVEAKDSIESVEAISLESKQLITINNAQCEFDYRSSIFKTDYKNLFVITHVNFRLQKQPVFQINYGSIKDELKQYDEINLENIRKVIIQIRESKLPDTTVLGNAGSFFKNPIVNRETANQLTEKFGDMPQYIIDNQQIKLAAGWLIEQCGWRGKRKGNVGVYDKQALVLVNHGNATGAEVLELANAIRKSVWLKFGVKLEPEVNAI